MNILCEFLGHDKRWVHFTNFKVVEQKVFNLTWHCKRCGIAGSELAVSPDLRIPAIHRRIVQ